MGFRHERAPSSSPGLPACWATKPLGGLHRECASALAATGLASLVLVPWLTYKLQWAQAILIGVMLFAVGALTKRAVRKLSVEQPESRREGGGTNRQKFHRARCARGRSARIPASGA